MNSFTSSARQEFLDRLDQDWLKQSRIPSAPSSDDQRLWGSFSHCDDTLPADYCIQLGIPQGSTYAQAVRQLQGGFRV